MENRDEIFDKHIRAKLENLDVPGSTEGWNILQQKIIADAFLNPTTEPTNSFDEIIKSKLEAGKAAYDPGFWSLMESKIESDIDLSVPELDDVQFDGIVYENLNYFQVPYNASHWELMARRIREEFSLQNKLYQYKVVEISLMLLFILTLIQFFPGKSNFNFDNNNNSEQVVQTAAASENNIAEVIPSNNADAIVEENPLAGNDIASNFSVKTEKQTTKKANSNNIPSIAAAAIAKKFGGVTSPFVLPELEIQNHTGTSISEKRLSLAQSNQSNADESTALPIADDLAETTELETGSIMDLLTLESSPMEALTYSNDDDQLPVCVLCNLKNPFLFKLGMMASMDLNLALTPDDEYFRRDAYSQLTTGYTGGISFGVFRGRWGLNTGVIYTSKNYDPKDNTELSGSLKNGYKKESLKAAQLNILSVPFNLSYTFDGSGQWQWYLLGGASAKFAAVNNFDVKTYESPRALSAFPGPSAPSSAITEEEDEAGPYDGILEGGSFKDNLFLTANLGFGMERYVSPRWSIFVQPIYQHYIYKHGIGPNDNRIHTMSFFLGTRATLK